MPQSLDESAARQIEAAVEHPGRKKDALVDRVQTEALQQFSSIQDDWLDLMWTLDAYRKASVPPTGMAGPDSAGSRINAIYRQKGNWFAQLVALLLENQTTQRVAARSRVQGFSQIHQIDVAWPDRRVDPLICTETKVTGGPAYGEYKARGAMSDWTNRRKELKFAATDLKLYRRGLETEIDHWDVWRQNQPPKTYFLWAARLGPSDRIEKIVAETQTLLHTYLDGAGVIAWRENSAQTGYEAVPLPPAARVRDLDDVIHRIAAEIKRMAGPGEQPPPPVQPEGRAGL